VEAITIPRSGGPEVLAWETVPEPEVGAGEVLVEVVASAVNRADLMQRQGFYPPPPGAPPYPGLECSGRIAAVGDGVAGWRVGDEVCALLAGGGYATRVAVPAGQVLPKPAGVSLLDAAGLPEVACTVWSNVGQLAHLSKGEAFLVHGGGSGIGTHAIQVAKALGATVLCTAGTEAKLARCRELGADVTIDYKTEDFVARVRDETGTGVDVILDLMGAKYLARNLEALAPNGRLAIIGMQGGTTAEIDLSVLTRKRAQVIGTVLRARPATEKAAIVAAVRERVWPLVESGAVRPVVDRVIPMRDAADAHRVVEAGDNIGKVLLAV
jgi:putative PIG3 family NAD(P)H quinone oxidoreductase